MEVANEGFLPKKATLTTGKQEAQQKIAPVVSKTLTDAANERILRMRWLALLLYLSPNVAGYAQQFEDILALSG